MIDMFGKQEDLCAVPAEARLVSFINKPAFNSYVGLLTSLSSTTISLFCPVEVNHGSRLALDWSFGPPGQHRTVLARVVETKCADAFCAINCELETPLRAEEMQAIWA
jgi:hypothetical protein